MDWKQLLFKVVTITLALLTTLVLFFLTHHQGERTKPLDSNTFDCKQHDFIVSSDCSPEYDGFCLNDGVCFFPCRHKRDRLHLSILIWRSKVWEVYVVNTALKTHLRIIVSSKICLNCRRTLIIMYLIIINWFWISVLVRNKNSSVMFRCHLLRLFWSISENCEQRWGKQSLLCRSVEGTFFLACAINFTHCSISTYYRMHVDNIYRRIVIGCSKGLKLIDYSVLASHSKVDSQLQWSPPDRTFRALNGQFIVFSVFNQITTPKTLQLFVTLTPQTVIDLQGFRFLNQTFISEESSVRCFDYNDTILLKTPFSIHVVSVKAQENYTWITIYTVWTRTLEFTIAPFSTVSF